MNILITGGTGFIGTYLSDYLLKQGYYLRIVSRHPDEHKKEAAKNYSFVGWDDQLAESMAWADVVINLAGANFFDQRWTDEIKTRIYDSRIESTKKLVEAMRETSSEHRPELFISGSAVGYYGNTPGGEVADEAYPSGEDFLAQVCVDWEHASKPAQALGVRVVNPRIGIALEEDGGALSEMLLPFKLFVGGAIGDGTQYMPWIHMHDLVRGLWFPVEAETMNGPYNLCAPNPVTMNELADALGAALHRPSWLKVPTFALRIAWGEVSDFLTASLNVVPQKLLEHGFDFHFLDVEDAVTEIVT
ncbi:MAG: TIGR01777 family oxidoreductase [Bacteroidota bacterium]